MKDGEHSTENENANDEKSTAESSTEQEHDDNSLPPIAEMFDLETWEAQAPPSDFAERVLLRVRDDKAATTGAGLAGASTTGADRKALQSRKTTRRRWVAITGGVAAAAIAAGVLLRFSGPPSQGEAIAKERVEVPIGSRAIAVLEPGANVRWNGDDVFQPRGDAFYRVEPGARFKVHTPAGDVEVKGTCFTVKVRAANEAAAAAAAAANATANAPAPTPALVFVAVYEGKVAVSNATAHVDLRAGEAAESGAEGVKRTVGSSVEGEKAFDRKAAALFADDGNNSALSATDKANQNLVRQVGEYRSRLETITAQKAELEGKLKRSEDALASASDGAAPHWKHTYDLSSDEWKELSKNGTIKFRMPCTSHRLPLPFQPNAEQLSALGLQSHDAIVIRDAYGRSNKRVWDAIKPICAAVAGSAETAERLGPDTCIHFVLDFEEDRDGKAAREARRQVGEIRAGIRPMPGPNEKIHPVTKLFLTATGESANMEADLAQSFGPEEAHRIVYSDELCFGGSTFGRDPGEK